MRMTPAREIRPPSCSVRVKGSLMNLEHAQQLTVGARKVMTVASERGRYWSDPKNVTVVRYFGCRFGSKMKTCALNSGSVVVPNN